MHVTRVPLLIQTYDSVVKIHGMVLASSQFTWQRFRKTSMHCLNRTSNHNPSIKTNCCQLSRPSHLQSRMFNAVDPTLGSLEFLYYKCQLWTYNQRIHDCSTGKTCTHTWNESIMSQGVRRDWLDRDFFPIWKKWILQQQNISDAFGGQNSISCLCGCMLWPVVNTHSLVWITISWCQAIRIFQMTEILAMGKLPVKTWAHAPEDWEKVVVEVHHKNLFHVTKMNLYL